MLTSAQRADWLKLTACIGLLESSKPSAYQMIQREKSREGVADPDGHQCRKDEESQQERSSHGWIISAQSGVCQRVISWEIFIKKKQQINFNLNTSSFLRAQNELSAKQ